MPKTLSCPTCNASLPPSATSGAPITCTYCGNHVIVPAEATGREPAAAPHAHAGRGAHGGHLASAGPSRVLLHPHRQGTGGRAAALLVLVILAVGGWLAFWPGADRVLDPVLGGDTGGAEVAGPPEVAALPGAADRPELPTAAEEAPAPLTTIGAAGTGVGQLDDAREVGVGGDGILHVGEFSSGRVQRFTADGEVLGQFIATDGEHVLQEMAVARDGTTYVIQGFDVHAYGATGARLPDVTYPGDEPIVVRDSVAPLPDGGLLVVELGTTLVWLDPAGQVLRRVTPEVLGGGSAIDRVAVDGQGTVFATGRRAGPGTLDEGVFVFDREGTFQTFFGADDAYGLIGSTAIAVDGRSRVAVTSRHGVQVFTADGRHLGTIELPAASGLAFDDEGTLWVALRDRVERWQVPGPR